MKFDLPTRQVETSGDLKVKEIGLSANAKAYKIIFGQIYPDIIKAIVREIFANGWDSQKEAGNLDTPIDIHLPTIWEPYFSVRDYGTGMTPEIIDGVYAEVFESTKDQDDEGVGMFGMGSKTPLGYTDSFALTSYVDGMFYAYDVYINETGKAVIALKATGETTEPSGVEVMVGVRKEDFNAFKSNAETFALNAGTPVNINRERFLVKNDTMLSGEDWVLNEGDHGIFIRMGCIVYKIDKSLFLSSLGYSSYSYVSNQVKLAWSEALALPLIINFPIGTFKVTGSREDIQYNVESANVLKEKILSVLEEIRNTILFDISNKSAIEEAYQLMSFFKKLKLIDVAKDRPKWKSWPLSKMFKIMQRLGSDVNVSFNPYSSRTHKFSRSFLKGNAIDPFDLYTKNATTYVVIDNDDCRKKYQRFQKLLSTLNSIGYKSSVAKSYTNNDYNYNILWVQCKPDTSLARLNAILPKKAFVINIRDIEPEALPPRVKREKKLDLCTRLTGRQGKYYVRSGLEEPEEEGYYIQVRGRRVTDQKAIYDALTILDISIEEIHVISEMKKGLIDKYNLISLFDAAEEAKKNISYNESTIFSNAAYNIRCRRAAEASWCATGNINLLANLCKFTYVETDVDENFLADINENVSNKLIEFEEMILTRLNKLRADHPILAYVNSYYINQEAENILKIIGEIE